jgi:hypothetical protein
MSFAIVCEARKGQKLGITHLALVDRRKCKTEWWTSDKTSLIMKFATEAQAKVQLRRLKHNCPQILPYSVALEWISEQANEIEESNNREQGWDSHKETGWSAFREEC